MNNAGIHWTSKTEYYDVETGEQITKTTAKKLFIIIKTNKHVTINKFQTHGTIKYTIECQRNPQTTIW